VIAIIGEFDALPGLSQDTNPEQRALVAGGAGHECGHDLFGTAAAASAIAVREWMSANGIAGTLRFYGSRAEEGGSGKVCMVRDGFFDDVDVAVTWHPGDRNEVTGTSSLANISGKVRFKGISAHAAASNVAAKTMALTAAELFTSPTTISAAAAEFSTQRGPNFTYVTRLGSQKPALDDRK
jgi:aminobenzoyl-glutamate utilization protein B